MDARYSLGLLVQSSGQVADVITDSPAYKAGLAPGFRIVAVNGRAFQLGLLRAAVLQAKGSGPALELIVVNTSYYKVIRLDYHGGERYPQLERVADAPDSLERILASMTQ